MCQLHFLRLLADHDKQYHSEKNARSNQHFAIRQALLKNKSQQSHDYRERQSKQCSLQHDSAP